MGDAYKEGLKARLLEGLDGRPLTWLEDQTGDSYKNVQRWVTGSTMPPPDFLARYARAVGLDGHYVLTGEPPKKRTPRERDAHAHAEAFGEIAAIVYRVAGSLDGDEGEVPTLTMREVHEGERDGGPTPHVESEDQPHSTDPASHE